jgi:hypothetical protein
MITAGICDRRNGDQGDHFAKQQFSGTKSQWVKSVVSAARADVRYYPERDRDGDLPGGRDLPLVAEVASQTHALAW